MARLAHTLYLQPVSLRKTSYRYMRICLSLSFTLQERCYTDSVSLCRLFCDKCILGHRFFNCEWTVKSKGYIQKGHCVLDICKIRYENSRCSVIVDNMKEDCVFA